MLERPRFQAGSRLLVTGGAGFIGSHIVERAMALGAEVRVLDDFSTGTRSNLLTRINQIELLVGDVSDLETCQSAMRNIDFVVHCAALASVEYSLEHPAKTLKVNVTGSANVLQAARDVGVQRVVYASSSSVYGTDVSAPQREGHEGTLGSPYALSKAMTEELATMYHRCYGVSAIGLRFFNVYGTRQSSSSAYAAVIPSFLEAVRRGRPLIVHGTGAQSRDFVHVFDVADVVLLALSLPQANFGVYNVGTGTATSIQQLAETAAGLRPGTSELEHVAPRANDILESYADMALFEQTFGARRWIALADGLRMTSASYLPQS